MPIRKKKDGYYWGSKGPYDTRKKAAEVGAAAGGPVEYSNTGSMSMGGYGGKRGAASVTWEGREAVTMRWRIASMIWQSALSS